MIEILSNLASIITSIIAVWWFVYTRKLNFYEKGNLRGTYKLFQALATRTDKNELAIIVLKIDHLSNRGWFTGRLDYSEIFRPPGARSEGGHNCVGYIKYNLLHELLSFFKASRANPLEFDKSKGYKGKVYILSRNDFDLERNWKDFLLDTFDIKYYRNTHRLKFENLQSHNEKTQLPPTMLFINTDFVVDNNFKFDVDTEFDYYPGFQD